MSPTAFLLSAILSNLLLDSAKVKDLNAYLAPISYSCLI